MFTHRRLPLVIATVAAGLVGTVGIVAASSTGTDRSPAAANPPAETIGSGVATATAASQPTVVPDPGPPPPAGEPATAGTPTTTTPAPTGGAPTEWPTPGHADDPEPPAPGEPGVETGGEPDGPPPPPPPPPVDLTTSPAGPDPDPIDDYAAPVDPTPWDVADDFQLVPLPGYLDTLSSGLEGCQLECVTTALLSSNPTNPNVQLDATTTVPVHFEVEVDEVDGDWGEFFNNPGYDTEWSTTLGPLQPETTYDLTLIAIDQDGHSKVYEHRFTTVAIVDGFASNASGCALECLTTGTVEPGGAPNRVEVHVETNTPAQLQVWFSTSAPTWVDDPAAKPAYGPVYANENPSTSWTFDVDDLEYDTLYHVVARAHDGHGEHYGIGTFRTGPQPQTNVLVAFERVTITHDGDDGDWNRGEIRLSWGFDGVGIGGRSEEKMRPRTIELGGQHQEWFTIDPTTEAIPNPTVAAHERDADGLIEFCSSGAGPGTSPHYDADCDTKTNVAQYGGPITLDEILAFDSCLEYGVLDAGAGARCVAIGSAVHGTRDLDYAHFTAVVSFLVDD